MDFRGKRIWAMVGMTTIGPMVLIQLSLAVLPTDWAVDRIEDALVQQAGVPVHIERVRIGPLGYVCLEGIRLKTDERAGELRLWVERAKLGLRVEELFQGQVAPSRVGLTGVVIEIPQQCEAQPAVVEQLVGTAVEIVCPRSASSSEFSPGPSRSEVRRNADSGRSMKWSIHGLTVVHNPEPENRHALVRQGRLSGLVTSDCLQIDEAEAIVSGGRLSLVGLWERQDDSRLGGQQERHGHPVPAGRWQAHLRLENAQVGPEVGWIDHLLPLETIGRSSLRGSVDLELFVVTEGTTLSEWGEQIEGRGRILAESVQLEDTWISREFAKFTGWKGGEVGTLRAEFQLHPDRVQHQNLTVRLGLIPIVLSGSTSHDGRIDYRLELGELGQRLTESQRVMLRHWNLDVDRLAWLRFHGRADDLVVSSIAPIPSSLDPSFGPTLTPTAPTDGQTRRASMLGRRLIDRIYR